ncbi:hypothetical protein [Cerasicoccus maritimus]|uniref:hypothetical protein n=1 Tax=Cerasicoccus maritimus TaxID=490089 RepID=UPI0028526139|nr:hypothetical protein [Cerasicoccus maritimus]
MKGLSIALRVLAILGAVAAAFFWYQTNGVVKSAQDETKAVRAELQAAESRATDHENEKIKYKGMAGELDTKLADANSKINFSSNELNKIKRDLGRQKNEYEELDKQYKDLDAQYVQLKKEIINVATPETSTVDVGLVKDLEGQIATLETQIGEQKDKIDALTFQLKSAANAVPTGDGVVSAGSGVLAPVKEQEASILRTDDAKGLLIISRGEVDGMQKQMEFNVAKGLGRKLRVKVGTVAPTYSVAYILPGQEPSRLQEGDAVQITQ